MTGTFQCTLTTITPSHLGAGEAAVNMGLPVARLSNFDGSSVAIGDCHIFAFDSTNTNVIYYLDPVTLTQNVGTQTLNLRWKQTADPGGPFVIIHSLRGTFQYTLD